jgi:hypothetical protein
MNADLTLALESAIASTKIPFKVYDASFFGGEGMLEGDWTVISESDDSEYAIAIETIKVMRPVETIAGTRMVEDTAYRLYYPYYDEGDSSVGLPDAWIIDFDYDKPDYETDGLVDAVTHAVFWFIKNDVVMRIDSDFMAREYARDEHNSDYFL